MCKKKSEFRNKLSTLLPMVGVFFVFSIGLVSANCSCDVNGDGKYTHGILPPNDYGIARDCFATKSGPSDSLIGGYSCAKVDFNGNGRFDTPDMNFFIDVCAGYDKQTVCTTSSTPTPIPTPPLVGGDVDEHGCKASAGYSWCAVKSKCLRTFEESCDTSNSCQCDLNGDNKLIVDGSTGDDVIFQSDCTLKWLMSQQTPVSQIIVDGISCHKADVNNDGKLLADDVTALAQKCGQPGNGTYLLVDNLYCSASGLFPDVISGNRNYDAINYSKQNGIINGYGNGNFGPGDFVTRGQLIKILVNYLYASNVDACSDLAFTDAAGSPFLKHVCVAKLKGIVTGYSDRTIRLDSYVTVGEALKMISNAFGYTSQTETQPAGDIFRPYINAITGKKAVPREVGNAGAYLTRGDLVEIIYRLKTNVINKESMSATEL